MIKTTKIMKLLTLTLILISSIIIASPIAKAAVTENGIIFGGNGKITDVLSTGETTEITLENNILTIEKDGNIINTFEKNFQTAFINSDVLHLFNDKNEYTALPLIDEIFMLHIYENTDGYTTENDETLISRVTGIPYDGILIKEKKYFLKYNIETSEYEPEEVISISELISLYYQDLNNTSSEEFEASTDPDENAEILELYSSKKGATLYKNEEIFSKFTINTKKTLRFKNTKIKNIKKAFFTEKNYFVIALDRKGNLKMSDGEKVTLIDTDVVKIKTIDNLATKYCKKNKKKAIKLSI